MNSASTHHFPMERVLFNLHHKCCTFALQNTSRRSRSWAEHSILVVAVCGFVALLLAHWTFVHRERSNHNTGVGGVGGSVGTMRSSHTNVPNIPVSCLSSIPGFVKETELTHLILIDDSISRTSSTLPLSRRRSRREDGDAAAAAATSCEAAERIKKDTDTTDTDTTASSEHSFCDNTTTNNASLLLDDSNDDSPDDEIVFSYSREKGYLLLSPDLCERHGVKVQYVQVSKSDAHCFGEPFLQTLVFSILGPDTVMVNWLLGTYDAQGYIYNPNTRVVIDLSHQFHNSHESNIGNNSVLNKFAQEWAVVRKLQELILKFTVVIKTSFLFFITTTLVSFTLRETQGRMLDFTHHLQEYVRANRPVVNLVTTHVVENLVFVPIMVGMIFFLIEFYRGDKFLAFMVLSLVWVCESFSVVSLRTKQGIHFFPRIFFLLFAIFHFYNFSFPFGFSYPALATSMCFMFHSMLFFWHRYELPAVVLGRVSPDHPRQGTASAGSTPSVQTDSGRNTPVQSAPVNLNLSTPRRTVDRSHSFNTVASGRMSRNSSTNGMFQQGDDDDESYMYFMGGEVVTHRNAPRPPSPYSPASEYSTQDGDPATDTAEPRRNRGSRIFPPERFVNELETLVASAFSTDEAELVVTPPATSSSGGLQQNEQPIDDYSEDNETSALQAILNVMEEESYGRVTSPTNSSDPDDPPDPQQSPVSIFR